MHLYWSLLEHQMILTNHGPVGRWYNLLCTRRQLDSRLLCLRVVRNDSCTVARSTCQLTTVSSFFLQATNDGTLRHHANGKDVANVQASCDKVKKKKRVKIQLNHTNINNIMFTACIKCLQVYLTKSNITWTKRNRFEENKTVQCLSKNTKPTAIKLDGYSHRHSQDRYHRPTRSKRPWRSCLRPSKLMYHSSNTSNDM